MTDEYEWHDVPAEEGWEDAPLSELPPHMATPKASQLEQLADDLGKRREAIGQTWQDFMGGPSGNRPLSLGEATSQTLGSVAGGAMDTLGAGFMALVPDELEEYTARQVQEFFESPQGKPVAEALGTVSGAWEEFKELYPQTAKTIGGVGNFATFGTPKKSVLGGLDDAAAKARVKSLKARHATDKERLTEMIVDPEHVGPGLVDEKGVMRTRTASPNAEQKEIIEYLHTVDTVDGARSAGFNLGRVQRELPKVEKQLQKTVGKAHRKRWKLDEVSEGLDEAMADLKTIPGGNTFNVENAQVARTLLEDAKEILRNAKKTPRGLLEARRAVDDVVNAGGDVLGSDAVNARKLVGTYIRNELNAKLIRLAGDDVYDALRSQHLLLKSQDILAKRAAKEGRDVLGRLLQNPYIHMPSTPLAQAATVGALVGSSVALPTIAGGATAGAGIYLALKGMSARHRNNYLAKTLSAIDKARKSKVSKVALDQLKADRAIVVDLMKTPEIWEQEEPQE